MKNLMVMVLVVFFFYGCTLGEWSNPRTEAIIRERPEEQPRQVLYYSQFGASGCGTVCDFEAIRLTHEMANTRGAIVRADPGATYLIGATTRTAIIRTDTDWGDARFIIDNTTVEMRGSATDPRGAWSHSWLFRVESAQRPFPVYQISSLRRFQPHVNLNLGQRVMLEVIDNTTRNFIRTGANQNAGDFKRDVFIVEKDGSVYPGAPIIWDFNNISTATAFPIDEHQLRLTGGRFTTIASHGTVRQPYKWRGIHITRSNVLVCGFSHEVVGQHELESVASHLGIFYVTHAADVTIQNTYLTGRVPTGGRGTYDLMAETTINFSLINVRQTNDINSPIYWGIFASNFSKNILFDGVRFSRFDAHRGVHNVTIRNSYIGHASNLIIGSGLMLVENTTVSAAGGSFIAARSDYGGTWEGNIIIRNGTLELGTLNGRIFNTQNPGTWWFGYDVFMPSYILVDGFRFVNAGNSNVTILHNAQTTAANAPFPLEPTRGVFVRGIVVDNGAPLTTSTTAALADTPRVDNWTEADLPPCLLAEWEQVLEDARARGEQI